MFFNRFNFKIPRNFQKTFFTATAFGLLVLVNSASVYGEEKTKNTNLPTAPDTGTPEEDFQSAGTRDNNTFSNLCDANSQQIVYLLGNNIRESTLSAHPVFWFNFPDASEAISQVEFVLKETDTDNKIYHRVVETPKQSGTVGIALPQEEQYALNPNINYSWSLNVDCVGEQQETLELTGWLRRVLPNTELQNRLATASESEKYRVYLEHNLLYDALNELAQRRTKEPSNLKIVTAWNQLLKELGWEDLARQSTVKFYVLQTDI